jgi:hypothetical protein
MKPADEIDDADLSDAERKRLADLQTAFPNAKVGLLRKEAAYPRAQTPPVREELARLGFDGEREQDPRLVDGMTFALSGGEPDQRPDAVDVAALTRWSEDEQQPMVLQHLIPWQSVIAITGEEGEGKTTLADQIVRQMARGDDALGMFEPGDMRASRTLFVDTEQEEAEVRRRVSEMNGRGLRVPEASLFWLWAGGLNLAASVEDRAYIEDQISYVGADFLWIDAGSNAVEDPKDDGCARAFFNYLSDLMRSHELKAQGLTLHPRKRAQGEYGRRFDDLFGSREFKGRTTKALYLDGGSVIAWKDRGGDLRKVWPNRAGGRYPKALLRRPGMEDETAVPFIVEPGEAEAEIDAEALERKALDLVEEQPEHYTKTTLAEALGGRRIDAIEVVGGLLRAGSLGPDAPRKKLTVQEGSRAELF